MKTLQNTTLRIATLLVVGGFTLTGCVDAPPSFGDDLLLSTSLSTSIFPLDEGSYWVYEFANGGILTGNPVGLQNNTIPFPTEISSVEDRYYYYEQNQEDRKFNYGPATAYMTTDLGLFGRDYGYLANDTMVVIGQEYGTRYAGKGILLEDESCYIPLKPVIGNAYCGLNEAVYLGTESIALPVYSGEVHVFTNGFDTFIFAEGVGLLQYRFEDPGNPLLRTILTLTEYRIGP